METITWITVLLWVNLGAGSQTDSSRSAPRLSSSLPHTVIIKGEEIPLNCSLPEGVVSRSPEGSHRFLFHCRDQSGRPAGDQHLPNNTFNVRTENLTPYQIKIICKCKIRESSGEWSDYPESNHLVFSVVDELPSPLLKVDPLSQKVKKGDPLVFLCSVEGGNAEKIFHFYKDGMEIIPREESVLEPSSEPTDHVQSASLRILHASFNHRGEFACRYEERRSNRWFLSSWSQGINMTVCAQDSDPIWRYSWMAMLLVILLVPFAFYCWKKKSTSQSQEHSQLPKKNEQRNDLAVMEHQAATAATLTTVKASEVTYSCLRDSFPPSPPGPTRKNRPTQREEEGILYSDIVFQPKGRQKNHP